MNDLKNNIKPIGEFLAGELVTIPGVVALCSGDYIVEVYALNWYEEISVTLTAEDAIAFKNTFNENAQIWVKVKLPAACSDPEHGVNYVTASGGETCFQFCSLPVAGCNQEDSEGPQTLIFDGVNELLAGDNWPAVNFERDQAFSINACINKTTSAGNSTIISKRNDAAGFFAGWQFLVSGGLLRVIVGRSSPNNYKDTQGTNLFVNDGNCHNVMITVNATRFANGIKIFVDGVKDTEAINSDTALVDIAPINVARLLIAAFEGGLQFPGEINKVIVWNSEVSVADALSITSGAVDGVNIDSGNIVVNYNANDLIWNGSEFDVNVGTSLDMQSENMEEIDKTDLIC